MTTTILAQQKCDRSDSHGCADGCTEHCDGCANGCPEHCQGCQDCPDVPFGRPAAEILAEMEEWKRRNPKLALGEKHYKGGFGHIPDGRTADGLENALDCLGIEIRYNVRSYTTEYRDVREFTTTDNDWHELTDRVSAKIREVLGRQFTITGANDSAVPFRFGRDRWNDCLNVLLYHREVDPFQEWLESLAPWDGEQRLPHWIFDVFDVSADCIPLARWAGQFVFLGTVWRTFQPGVKLDEMPVLIGRGGLGKSTAIRSLLPPKWQHLFSDALRFTADDKARAEALQGRAIVEAAEMAGASRAEIDSMKAFLTRTDDGSVRLAYRRNPERLLRRCIIIGTADNERPLPNDPNLRRFVPVQLNGGNPAKVYAYMGANQEQLWAEALHLYRQGVEAWLPTGLQLLQKDATDKARSGNIALETAIDDFLDLRGNMPFQSSELFASIGLVDGQGSAARVDWAAERAAGAYLRVRGWTYGNQRISGVQKKCWHIKD